MNSLYIVLLYPTGNLFHGTDQVDVGRLSAFGREDAKVAIGIAAGFSKSCLTTSFI